MEIPLPVAIAIATNRQNKREVVARKRENKMKEENSKERKASWQSYYYTPDYSYIDNVVFAIRTNSQLKDFFKKLDY